MKQSDNSFSPRVSNSAGSWQKSPSLFDRIRTRYLVAAALVMFGYCAGIYIFGDGAGW